MKKLLTGLSLIVLLAGCASRDNGNGMGGTADQPNNADTSDQYHNNATRGTGTDAGTNNATGKDNTGQPMSPSSNQ